MLKQNIARTIKELKNAEFTYIVLMLSQYENSKLDG